MIAIWYNFIKGGEFMGRKTDYYKDREEITPEKAHAKLGKEVMTPADYVPLVREYPQQTSISASVWSQQYVQYVPDWSCTNALLQYQAEIDRLHRQLEQKTLKEEELKNLFTMHGNGYFSTMGSGRVVQLTCFLFERVEELIYDPLYGRKSQVRIKLTTQVESDLLDMDDFLNDKKFLLFLERLSRSKIKCYSSAKQVSMLLRSIAAERMDDRCLLSIFWGMDNRERRPSILHVFWISDKRTS